MIYSSVLEPETHKILGKALFLPHSNCHFHQLVLSVCLSFTIHLFKKCQCWILQHIKVPFKFTDRASKLMTDFL